VGSMMSRGISGRTILHSSTHATRLNGHPVLSSFYRKPRSPVCIIPAPETAPEPKKAHCSRGTGQLGCSGLRTNRSYFQFDTSEFGFVTLGRDLTGFTGGRGDRSRVPS